jgi:hypothetical protein
MRWRRSLFALLAAVGLAGCGGSSGVPVSGTVRLNDQPLPGAVVMFYPGPGTPGLGGGAATESDGTYTLKPSRGGGGLPPGEYVVTISRSLRPDGSPPPPGAKPIESDARETLPAIYSSRQDSTLRVKVEAGKTAYDFALRVAGKK